MEPRYVILGAGGIGCSLGGLLQARAGRRVQYVARGAQLVALREKGLHLALPDASLDLRVDARGLGHHDLADGDVVLLCTKSQDTAAALDAPPLRGRAVVCMQNGVGNERLVAGRGGRPYAGMVFLPATFLEPGRVAIHSAPCPGVVDVGRYPSGVDALCERLAADLRASGLDSRALDDVMPWKYAKLLANLGNVLQALGGNDGLRSPDGQTLRAEVVSEGEAVLGAAAIPHRSLRELFARTQAVVDLPVEGQARGGGSSWQSLARGGTLETPHLNGEIVRLGREHGVPTPLNAGLVRLAEQASREGWPPAKLSFPELVAALGP